MKSGFVSIVGKTNVGKSSIINSLVGEKVAAIANRPQTTRKAIKAIVNRPDSQIIFIDTPGIHKPQSKLSDAMIETSLTSIQDVDLIVFVVEAFAKEISEEEKIILEKIKKDYNPSIYIIGRSHERITPNFNITIDNDDPTLRMFSNAVAIQMLALEIAKKLGRNVDKPKGLVKVVKEN